MASNRYPVFIIAAVLCLTVPASLWAQSSGFQTENSFIQRLTWVGDEYAMRYEVIIEKEEDGKYKRVLQEFTTAFFIEVSLPSGKYRYQVIPYDFLDHPVPITEWMDFEVRRRDIIIVDPGEPESKNEIVLPSSGPETAIEYKNPFGIYLGIAWMPIMPIYGENEFFDRNLSPYCGGLRLGIIPIKLNLLDLGIEGTSSWQISPGQMVRSLTFDLNIVARFLDGRVGFNSRLGAGVSLRHDASMVSAVGQYAIHANLGVSILWLPLKHLYLEAGMEYVQFFAKDNFGFFRPSVGLGVMF